MFPSAWADNSVTSAREDTPACESVVVKWRENSFPRVYLRKAKGTTGVAINCLHSIVTESCKRHCRADSVIVLALYHSARSTLVTGASGRHRLMADNCSPVSLVHLVGGHPNGPFFAAAASGRSESDV